MEDWRFKICGLDSDPVPLSHKKYSNTEELQQALSPALRVLRSAKFHFHLEDESCSVQRPLQDLYRHWGPEQVEDQCVLLHPSHPVTLTPTQHSDGPPATVADATLRQPVDQQAGITHPKCQAGGHDAELGLGMQEASTTNGQAVNNTDAGRGASGATCTIVLNFEPTSDSEPKLTAVKLDHAVWTTSSITLKLSDDLITLKELVKDRVLDRIMNDRALRQSFDPSKNTFYFRTAIEVEGHDDYVNLDVASHAARIPKVADLFIRDLPTALSKRDAFVTVYFEDIVQPSQTTFSIFGKASTKASEKLQLSKREHFDKYVQREDEHDPHFYIRIGSMAERTGGDISVEYAIVARRDGDNGKLVELLRVPAWDFGSFCIGDVDQGDHMVFSNNQPRTIHKDFDGVANQKELAERLLDPTIGLGDPRVPFQPAMTFRIFDPSSSSPPLGAEIDDQQILVVYRYVSHLDSSITKSQNLHDNAQGAIEAHWTRKQIVRDIREQLRDSKSSLVDESGRIVGGYGLELWVLPQDLHPQVLHRYPTNRPGSCGTLVEFMSQDMVDAGDLRLYIEVHIWPFETQYGYEEESESELDDEELGEDLEDGEFEDSSLDKS